MISKDAENLLKRLVDIHQKTGDTLFHCQQIMHFPNYNELLGELAVCGFIEYENTVTGKITLTESGINYFKC